MLAVSEYASAVKPIRAAEEGREGRSSRRRGREARGVLRASPAHLHFNSKSPRHKLRSSGGKNSAGKKKAGGRRTSQFWWEDEVELLSPTSVNRELEEQGIVGVFNDWKRWTPGSTAGSRDNAQSPPNQRPTLQHRRSPDGSGTISGAPESPVCADFAGCRRVVPTRSLGAKYSGTATRRMMLLAFAVGLVGIGYFSEVRQIIESSNAAYLESYAQKAASGSKDWLMTMPQSLSLPNLGESAGRLVGSLSSKVAQKELPVVPISIEEERGLAASRMRSRSEMRRMRTKPPSAFPTNGASASALVAAAAKEYGAAAESTASAGLTLDLPSHRELNPAPGDDVVIPQGPKYAYFTSAQGENKVRRRLSQMAPTACGPQAQEASQLNPQHYPLLANVNKGSRIVVTGALSQVGMELILQLFEQCDVKVIIGIDAAYPNTRHERLDAVEHQYEYIQRRVPVFQRIIVPVFGIHPHPNMGQEATFESMGGGFDLVRRLKPTHIVHLAGMEEGRGEYPDYGDTVGTSPFEPTGRRSMMRMFDSLLSMDQVLSSLARFNKSPNGEQPQLVYLSSTEANDRSGVSMEYGADPYPASVYGTSSLLKEVLASYYHRHHGVHSVGLRVPTIIGPFSRPGSLAYDLAERTIRNAVGKKNAEGVPSYHLDRDRFELNSIFSRREEAASGALEQMAYVYDVASAIVAAMQFKSGSETKLNGPTLMRIGSKFTTSMKDLQERMEEYLPPANPVDADTAISLTGEDTFINSPGLTIYDKERNRDLLGWTHTTSVEEGIKSALAWQVLKAYPYGLAAGEPGHASIQGLLEESRTSLSYHSLPCAAGCRWGGGMCSPSPWDEVLEATREITESCPYVLYTVDLRPELKRMDKQSDPSSRPGWEEQICKIAFVSSSSELVQTHYESELARKVPMDEWNGKNRQGEWIIVAVPGTHESMPEYERIMAKMSPTNLFNEGVEMAMFVNHRRIVVSTDQALNVMAHMEMAATESEEATITDPRTKEEVFTTLPSQPARRSLFFTNKFTLADGHDASSASTVARFVLASAGIAETAGTRRQREFYDETTHLIRTNVQRSPTYQEVQQDNFFTYDFVRTSWLIHELRSEEGRRLRCEMYEEHSLWGNAGMEDLSMSYVLAKKRVRLQLARAADARSNGPEEWIPLLVPKGRDDENAIKKGPVYLEHLLESAQKTATDSEGAELYITMLQQKSKG